MNKVISLIICFSIAIFAQNSSSSLKPLGVRAMFVKNSVSFGYNYKDWYLDVGTGFGVGFVANFPVTNGTIFSPEANFLYRTLFEVNEQESGQSLYEYALSFPIMLQLVPIVGAPLYFTGGIQIDIPFNTRIKQSISTGKSKKEAIDDRAVLDLGIAIGVGYRLMSKVSVDVRVITCPTGLFTERDDESSYQQFGLGVNYFF